MSHPPKRFPNVKDAIIMMVSDRNPMNHNEDVVISMSGCMSLKSQTTPKLIVNSKAMSSRRFPTFLSDFFI